MIVTFLLIAGGVEIERHSISLVILMEMMMDDHCCRSWEDETKGKAKGVGVGEAIGRLINIGKYIDSGSTMRNALLAHEHRKALASLRKCMRTQGVKNTQSACSRLQDRRSEGAKQRKRTYQTPFPFFLFVCPAGCQYAMRLMVLMG